MVNLSIIGLVFKFYHTVYAEHSICPEIKAENKTRDYVACLKMQQTSLLPKYIKLISRGISFTCVHICGCRSFKVNKWDLRFPLWYKCGFLNVMQCSLIAPYKGFRGIWCFCIQVRTISHVWKKSIIKGKTDDMNSYWEKPNRRQWT
jgi:hypothetical protein